MKQFISKDIIKNFLINFVLLLILELIFKIVNFFPIFDWSTLRILLSNIFISFLVASIEYFFPKILTKIINIFIISLISIYALAQSGFNNFIGVYMSLGTSSQFGAVVDYIKEFIFSFRWYYYFNLIPILLISLYYIFLDKKVINKYDIKEKEPLPKKKLTECILIAVAFLIIVSGSYISTLYIPFMQNKMQSISNKELFKNPSVPSISIKEFGISLFGVLDVRNFLFPKEEIENYVFENEKNKTTNNNSRVFDDTNWNTIIENEKDKNLNTLNNYFINNDITETNSYTGLFKDKNLIVIMMESVNDIFINEEMYPNFYKLYNEGWHWENNYSPRNSCSTGNNEMSGMIGLYSIYNTCTANKYKKNKYFESIFNLFTNKGYKTFSAHDYLEHYYYRNTIHTNMGSGRYYGVEDLGIKYSSEYKNWASDEDFLEKVVDILKDYKGDKFMTWLTTVSSHQPYSVSSTEGDKYLSLFDDLDVKKEMKRYMSKLKILDNGLGILLDGLEDLGILDDTVILLFGDHYPYGLSKNLINTVLDYDVSEDYEAERVPFVIYNPDLDSKVYDEFTSYVNIVPTVANLFDLNYDPRLYVGTDILSDDYKSLVVFADGSWRNDIAYYNASKGKIKYYTDKEYSVDEIKEINEVIENKMNMSSLAIKNNYFNYLYNKLNELNTTTNES